MKKGDTRILKYPVKLTENPSGHDGCVMVELKYPRHWTKQQRILVHTGWLSGQKERQIQGCRECVKEKLQHLTNQKVLQSETITIQIQLRATCVSNHNEHTGEESDDGKSSAYEEED